VTSDWSIYKEIAIDVIAFGKSRHFKAKKDSKNKASRSIKQSTFGLSNMPVIPRGTLDMESTECSTETVQGHTLLLCTA